MHDSENATKWVRTKKINILKMQQIILTLQKKILYWLKIRLEKW